MEHWFYWSLFLHLFNQATTLNPSRTLFFTRWCVEEGRCLQGRRSGLTLELGWTTGAHPGGVRKKEGLHWLLTPAKCCKESDMTEQLNWSVFKSVFPNLLQVVAHTEKEKFIRCNGGTQKALKSPLDSKEIQPVNPKGNHPEYSLKGLMLKLKLQYLSYLIQRASSLEKILMLGKIEGGRRGQQRMKWLDDITDSVDMGLSQFWETVKDREALHAAVHRVAKNRTRLSDWTTIGVLLHLSSYHISSFKNNFMPVASVS